MSTPKGQKRVTTYPVSEGFSPFDFQPLQAVFELYPPKEVSRHLILIFIGIAQELNSTKSDERGTSLTGLVESLEIIRELAEWIAKVEPIQQSAHYDFSGLVNFLDNETSVYTPTEIGEALFDTLETLTKCLISIHGNKDHVFPKNLALGVSYLTEIAKLISKEGGQ